jgi:hypothetical protein
MYRISFSSSGANVATIYMDEIVATTHRTVVTVLEVVITTRASSLVVITRFGWKFAGSIPAIGLIRDRPQPEEGP